MRTPREPERSARARPARNANGVAAKAANAIHSSASTWLTAKAATNASVTPAADEQRHEAAALGRRRRAPLAHQHPDRHEAEAERDRRAERERDVAEAIVALDQQHVARTSARAVGDDPLGVADEQRRDRHERDQHVARRHDPAARPRRQPAGREAQQHVAEDRPPEPSEDDAEGEHERRVRREERPEEPREAHQDHQQAEARLRPAAPRIQAGADEAPPDQRPEQRLRARIGEVVASEHEQHVADSAEQGRRRDGERPTRRHEPILTPRAAAG